MAQQVLAHQTDTIASATDSARAWFILARVSAMTGHPEQAIDDFQKTLATSKEQRLLAWSHIYLGRMLDLDCKRDQALSEYKLALTVRDGREDTRLAAERGVKNAYSVNGHTCDEDADEDTPGPVPPGKARQRELMGRTGLESRNSLGRLEIQQPPAWRLNQYWQWHFSWAPGIPVALVSSEHRARVSTQARRTWKQHLAELEAALGHEFKAPELAGARVDAPVARQGAGGASGASAATGTDWPRLERAGRQ